MCWSYCAVNDSRFKLLLVSVCGINECVSYHPNGVVAAAEFYAFIDTIYYNSSHSLIYNHVQTYTTAEVALVIDDAALGVRPCVVALLTT